MGYRNFLKIIIIIINASYVEKFFRDFTMRKSIFKISTISSRNINANYAWRSFLRVATWKCTWEFILTHFPTSAKFVIKVLGHKEIIKYIWVGTLLLLIQNIILLKISEQNTLMILENRRIRIQSAKNHKIHVAMIYNHSKANSLAFGNKQ